LGNAVQKLNLSKSLYTKGLQCEKALWLKKYNPEVLTPPSLQLQAVFKTGNEVGALACDLFPGGKEVPFKGTSFKEKISLTQKWLDEGVRTIYEATFSFDDILVMVDILHQNENGSFEIYEVKSSTWNQKKSIDDIYKYIHDVSIQYFVLTGLGYNVSNTYITLLNTDYVRGSEIDLNRLFSSVRVTDEVLELNRSIPANIERFRETLKDLKNEPKIDIGYHCYNPYECDAQHYCWSGQRQIPEYSVFNIFPFNKNAKSLQLYREGINAIEDIPSDFKLSPTQEIKVDIWKYQKSIVNKEAIKDFVDSLRYPIYHFDFETLNPAIPKFEGLSSYEKYPFQYSIHIEHADGTLEHKEFLAEPDKDPREEIARKITEDIPRDSFVMAYNIGFEKSVIKKLANQFPVYSDHLMSLYDNFVDLQTPFKNRDYLTPDMKGKSGLKTILPILVPEMEKAYKDLDMVHEGGEAMDIYKKLADTKDLEMISRYKSALIEYCKLDTLAMVKILQKLKEI
jgi:hypothetical protein